MSIRVCIDIGGTFTDLATVNDEDGRLNIFKTSTTPHDYAKGVIEGLYLSADFYGFSITEFMRQCSSNMGGAINYGTTIATNAIIQKKVSKVGLICTSGHRDILTLREGGKEEPFIWNVDFPEPYIPRYLTIPVKERIDSQGNIIQSLDETQVRESIRQLKSFEVEVIAVSLLWSIMNQVHELRIAEIIEEEWPGQPCVLSHIVNPIIREYRRSISTVINASLLPIVGPYIRGFDERLRELGYEGNLSLISAFGGIMSIDYMMRNPIYSVDSGPTGGPVAGLLYAKSELNNENVVTCDMGGTSFDVSRVTNGVIETTVDAKIGFDHLGIRKVDTRSIGAGGGSIAWVDAGGLLHVGPQSAGSQPGPACYKRGGTNPTTTDANLVLGYLNSKYLLDGRMELDKTLSYQCINDKIVSKLGVSAIEAAFTIWSTVNVNMTDAIRTITSWEGIDPREYTFVSGGGAAGMHIIPMMADLGVRNIIIPKAAGVLSAVGGLSADMVADFQRNYECNSVSMKLEEVNRVLEVLKGDALEFLMANGVEPNDQEFEYFVDASYREQPWNLTIQLPLSKFQNKADIKKVVNIFHETHDRIRGSKEESEFVEFSNWRVKAVGKTKEMEIYQSAVGKKSSPDNAISEMRMAYFKDKGGLVETTVYNGDKLKPGNRILAPAIIEEMATTIVIFPGSEVKVSALGNYLVSLDQ